MIWKNIPGYWGKYYQASSEGQIKSKDRNVKVLNPFGKIGERKYKGRVLKLGKNKKGYYGVRFTSPIRKHFYNVHYLIAITFLGPRPRGKEILHKNGISTDNRVDNLRYGTSKENAADKYAHGYKQKVGDKSPLAKLSKEQFDLILRNEQKLSIRAWARRFNISHGIILNRIKMLKEGRLD